MKRQQSGFTLIELIVVIVILGILAATALPRFADLSVDARVASGAGVEGALRSANAIAHAQALVKGQTGATGTITMEGSSVSLAFGYPDDTGIDSAVDIQGSSINCTGTGPYTCTIDGITGCTVTFAAATSATVPPNIQNNAITGNCE